MRFVLVSACLLGERVRYHGGHAFTDDPHLATWVRQGRVRALCPEVMAGFGTPRETTEIEGGVGGRRVLDKTARVLTRSGRDVTSEFAAGANAAVELARATAAQVAVLKDGSPSCGSQYIADGAFAGRRVMHEGVAAAALRALGLAWLYSTSIKSNRPPGSWHCSIPACRSKWPSAPLRRTARPTGASDTPPDRGPLLCRSKGNNGSAVPVRRRRELPFGPCAVVAS